MVSRPRGLAGQGREEGGAGGGGGWLRCRPGGQGHGSPELRQPAGPGGRVALGLCAAPEVPAQSGRGARLRAEPTGPPSVPGPRP